MSKTLIACGIVLLTAVGCSGKPEAEPEAAPQGQARAQPVSRERPAPPPPTETAGTDKPQLALTAVPREAGQAGATAGLDVVHELTRQFYAGDLESIHERFTPDMKKTMSIVQLERFHTDVVTHYGKETKLIGEESQSNEEYRAFARWARFDKTDEVIEVQWILAQDDSVAGLFVKPAKKSPEQGG